MLQTLPRAFQPTPKKLPTRECLEAVSWLGRRAEFALLPGADQLARFLSHDFEVVDDPRKQPGTVAAVHVAFLNCGLVRPPARIRGPADTLLQGELLFGV